MNALKFIFKDIIIKGLGYISSAVTYILYYKIIYVIIGLFTTRKFPEAQRQHRYAVMIAARNEEAVISKLLESIAEQSYPKELVTTFVVADNCTDNTAKIARGCGAVCYERHDTEHRTKGYALQFLVNCIKRDYGDDAFEAFFVFDADNLLKSDYIARMNEAFDAGEKIVTSYRNTKNFDDNWIAASYGIHWLRTARTEGRARSLLRLAHRIQGTGFMFAAELIKDGWNYTSLTEDRAFCADAVTNGYKISYNHAAEFYDEQPNNLRIALRQRIRWAKGHIQALAESGGKLLKNTVAPKRGLCSDTFWARMKLRFMNFDMFSIVYPRALVSFFKRILILILRSVLVLCGLMTVTTFLAPSLLKNIFKWFDISFRLHGWAAVGMLTLYTVVGYFTISYLKTMIVAAYIYIIEYRRIKKFNIFKKIFYCLTFPLFDVIGKISLIIACFSKVEWKPIPHTVAVGIDQMPNEDEGQVAPAHGEPFNVR